MNVVALIGNAASDPELRYTTSGKAVCSVRLAVNRPGADNAADFFDVVCWERTAEIVAEYVKKGRKIAVEGRMHHVTWETEGAKRSKVEVVANRVELLGGRDDAESTPPSASAASDGPADSTFRPVATVGAVDDDDIPF